MDGALRIPGTTNAWTMPIKARIDMLSTGVRTPVGIKVLGADAAQIEGVGERLETLLHEVRGTRSAFAERTAGGYFVDFEPRRDILARYGLTVGDLQDVILTAIGGENVTTTIEGRARYPVNVRYPRELRDDLDKLRRVLVATPSGAQVPLGQISEVQLVQGPAMVRDENGFLAGYVYVDIAGRDLGGWVEEAKKLVRERLDLPAGTTLLCHLRAALRQHALGVQGFRGHAGRALLGHRRRGAFSSLALRRLGRRLGGDDRALGAGCRDCGLHAAVPRSGL
jgi:Cu(I)/Ag(I) efflux system membrane protein CusA/SilA